MKKYSWIVILINLLLLLGWFNNSILQKEKLLSEGKLILFELAPVDPRSLMQGDFMNLRYALTDTVRQYNVSKRGYCIVKLNDAGIANQVRIQDDVESVSDDEYLIKYTVKEYRGLNIGAGSFFFQEGEAYKYEDAKYGAIRVDDQGNSLLVGLYDRHRQFIE